MTITAFRAPLNKQNEDVLVFISKGLSEEIAAGFFISLFSCYLPFVISLNVTGTERSVKTRKQTDRG